MRKLSFWLSRRGSALSFVVLLTAGISAVVTPAAPPTMSVEDIRPGMRGVVETVLQGNELQAIEIELLGIMEHGIGPNVPMILCRLDDDLGRWVGVAAGMSGSPVTVDGKLVGALSYSIGSFSKEPMCGVTPIATMLDLETHPAGLDPWWLNSASNASRPISFVSSGLIPGAEKRFADIFEQMAPGGFELSPVSTAVPMSGALSAKDFGDASWSADQVQPGSAVGALLVWGDLRFASTGTVTWRDGDRLLAFGHPFFGTGRAEWPMAPGRIVWTVPSTLSSFKISELGPPVGTVTQDRLTGIEGRFGEVPKGMPLRMNIAREGVEPIEREFFIGRDPFLGPLLADLVVRQTVLISTGAERSETLLMDARMTLTDGRTMEFSVAGYGGAFGGGDAALGRAIARRMQQIRDAPFPLPEIASIETTLRSMTPDAAWSIRGARPDRLTVAPGETVTMRVNLEGPRGLRAVREIAIEVPQATESGRYTMLLGAENLIAGELGALDEAKRRTARNADEYLDAISRSYDQRQLSLAMVDAREGLVADGHEYPALPSSATKLMRGRPGGRELYRSKYAELARASVGLERPVTNLVKAAIEVVKPADD